MAARYVRDVFPVSVLTLVMVTIPICIIVRGHARSHGTRRKVGRAWLLAYSEDDIWGPWGWAGVTVRHVMGLMGRLIESS
jgi:hypothetical protein